MTVYEAIWILQKRALEVVSAMKEVEEENEAKNEYTPETRANLRRGQELLLEGHLAKLADSTAHLNTIFEKDVSLYMDENGEFSLDD